MKDMEISAELKVDIENNQNRLKTAIRNHQCILCKLNEDSDNVDLQKEFNKAEENIIAIGLEQKTLLERLRIEYKSHQSLVKNSTIKTGIEDRRFTLTNAISRARKQNIVIRSSPISTFSEESNEGLSIHSSPEHTPNPLEPHDVSQSEFLGYFCLATHEAYREMQNKRVERKRRSTANPHFLYGNKGWDFLPKRKRNAYLVSTFSPPNTRQAVKKRNERVSPPMITNSANETHTSECIKTANAQFPSIPNLPSGLTIERVSPSSSPDSQSYVFGKQPEKLEQKQKLQEENESLTAELTQLQDRHSQLTISLKNEQTKKEELLSTQQTTQEKINQIMTFIENIKKPMNEPVQL